MPKQVFFFFCLFLQLACFNSPGSENKEDIQKGTESNIIRLDSTQRQHMLLTFTQIEQEIFAEEITLNGKVELPSHQIYSITPPMGGYLKHTDLLVGQAVSKGQVLAILEDNKYITIQKEYLMAKNQLQLIQAEYERQKELLKNNGTSTKTFQQVQAEWESTKINLSALTENLKLIHINPEELTEQTLSKSIFFYSPIDGYVSKVNGKTGQYIAETEQLFEIIQPSHFHIVLTVLEKDLSHLSVNQRLTVSLLNEPEKEYKCRIVTISQNISDTRYSEVHCEIEGSEKDFVNGLFVRAKIMTQPKKVWTVPSEAMVNFEGEDFVFIDKDNNNFEMIKVQKGMEKNSRAEIIDYEKLTGKKIVLQESYTLLMALKNKAEEE